MFEEFFKNFFPVFFFFFGAMLALGLSLILERYKK
jgi:hypothetical protein